MLAKKRFARLVITTFLRDFSHGRFTLFLTALTLTITLVTSLSFFYQRIELGSQQHFQTLLGADLLLTSNQPLADDWEQKAQLLGLRYSRVVQFYSILSTDEQLLLTEIYAVDQHYPLKGQMTVSDQPTGVAERIDHPPQHHQLWLAPAAFESLQLELNDSVRLGAASFAVTHYLQDAPAYGGRWLNLSPRAFINIDALAATQVIQPGSRLQYQLYLAGNAHQLAEFKAWLQPQLQTGQKLLDANQSTPRLNTIADDMYRYLNLVAILAVVIAGIVLALTSRYYANAQLRYCAVLRCFGLPAQAITVLFIAILLILISIASIVGGILGFASQYILLKLLENFISFALPMVIWTPIAQGFAYAILLTIGFSLPYLISLGHTPIRVLLSSIDVNYEFKTSWIYLSSLLIILLLIYWQTQNVLLTLTLAAGSLGGIAVLWLILHGLIRAISKIRHAFSFEFRQAFAMLIGYKNTTLLQLACTCILITAIFTLTLSRNELFNEWQQQIPENAHNYFLINILASDKDSLVQILADNAIETSRFYPIIRARLSERNGASFFSGTTAAEQLDNALQRDLNLSESMQIPPDNTIIEGSWWQNDDVDKPFISVEEQLAERLHIKLNDELTFQVADNTFSGIVTNIRRLQWDNFQPNFYFLFPEGVLTQYPFTYLVSFYLPPGKNRLLAELTQRYPSLTVINITEIIDKFTTFLQYLINAINYVLLFTLIMAFIMLIAIAQVNWKNYQSIIAVLRTLGASDQQIKRIILWQYLSIGVLGGLIGALFTTLTAWSLAYFLFHLPFYFSVTSWIFAPFVSGAVFYMVGIINSKKLLQVSPLALIQN